MTVQYPLPPGLAPSPSAAFAALRAAPGVFWLDSGDRCGPHARYHFLGCEPARWVRISERDPFPHLRVLLEQIREAESAWLPAARMVGYLAYDLGRFVERVPPAGLPTTAADEAAFAVYRSCVTYDMETGRAWVTATSPAAGAELERRLGAPAHLPLDPGRPLTDHAPLSPIGGTQYGALVDRVQELIRAGDVYQVNLSHRFEATLRPGVRAADVYQRLRTVHPACYGAFFDCGACQVVSNSPEGFLTVDLHAGHRRRIRTWPLKGTRPRSSTPEELRDDPKERAEHVMIVDLMRNDLGRVAVVGSVRVPRLLEVVTHPTVHHLESRIEAVPRSDVDLADILRATFPGGSITGAPKIRSMEIIAELETSRRGVYCGALGYVGWDGLFSRWSIPIRTAVVEGSRLELRSGGGIVADSDGRREYEETLTKASAFLDVLDQPSASASASAARIALCTL